MQQKKIFIVSPHFPPSALPPAQRVRLLIKHLSSLGFYPYVFTTKACYREEDEDPWMVKLAGNEFVLFELKSLPQHLTRKIGIGDLGLRFIPFLVPTLIKKIKEEKPDFILYPVPPWYILVISPFVKRITKIPYGIDFIDPWVTNENIKYKNFKKWASQRIARFFEKRAVKNASIIYSVSEGINTNIKKRYNLSKIPMFAIPYGVEPGDYSIDIKEWIDKKEEKVIRYIGAVWNDAYPVIEAFLKSLSIVQKDINIKIEFIGTSYAGRNLAKSQLYKWFDEFNMHEYTTELPNRVPYRKAIEMVMTSDLLLLFGGMEPYYAASKLMGLLANKKPFLAFLHKDSFPASLLAEINYPYYVTYSGEKDDLPETKINQLVLMLKEVLINANEYTNAKFIEHPEFINNTAMGMTKQFVRPITQLLENE